jgi:hypothetical protein
LSRPHVCFNFATDVSGSQMQAKDNVRSDVRQTLPIVPIERYLYSPNAIPRMISPNRLKPPEGVLCSKSFPRIEAEIFGSALALAILLPCISGTVPLIAHQSFRMADEV